MDFGNFPALTWANGGAPAINDVNLQSAWDAIDDIDQELRRSQTINGKEDLEYFFNRNCKEIDNFTDQAEYTAWASTTLSNDTTNNIMGKNAVKVLESDNVASFVGMWKNITSMNLELFNDESASAVGDIILCIFYIADVTKIDYVTYKFGDDNSNNYNVSYAAATCVTGWNVKRPWKSMFATTGAPTGWDDITFVCFQYYSKVNAQNTYITFRYCQLCRADPDFPGYYAPFQKYMGSVTGWDVIYTIYRDYYALYVDEAVSRLGFIKVDPRHTKDDLFLTNYGLSNFIAKFEMYCKKDGYSQSVIWRVDADNFAEIYMDDDSFYLDVTEGGILTQYVTLCLNLDLNERFEVYFEKNN